MKYKYNYHRDWVNNNFDIRSFKATDRDLISHILKDNTISNSEATPEKELEFKNIVIKGKAKNLEETINYIDSLDKRATGKNKFPFKVIVSTLNLKPQEKDNQAIILEWAKHQIKSWEAKGLEVIISGLHLNETSVNLHIIVNNTREEKEKLLYGWGFKSIKLDKDIQREKDIYFEKIEKKNKELIKQGKKPKRVRKDIFGVFETKQLHRNQEKELELFCKKHNLTFKQESTRIKGKSLSIQEYKKIYSQLDSQAIQDSSNMIKQLTKQLEKQNKIIEENKPLDKEAYLIEIKKRDEIISKLVDEIQSNNKNKKQRSK